MKVVVLDKLVRANLTLFRHLIHRQAEQAERHFKVARKSYDAFVNVFTGELRFKDLEIDFQPSRDWCHILIQLRPDSEGAFEVLQPEHGEVFDCLTLKPEAYQQLSKTMRLLNQLSYDPKNGRNPFWILRHLAHIDFLLSHQEEGERNLIHNAWFECDREGAEKLLEKLAPGTYLFRKGAFASLLEDSINEERERPVTCITITYRDWEKKIGEKTLVHSDGEWIIFNDDINLRGPRYTSVKDLISSMGDLAIRPLLVA